MPAAVKSAVALIAPPADPVAAARAARDAAAQKVAGAESTLAELEAGKTTLALDDDLIAAHVTKVQIAQSRVEIARRLYGEADAALAQAEVDAEARRKETLFADAIRLRDAAIEEVRRRYPDLVTLAASLRAMIDEADAKVAEANRARISDKPHLAFTEEAAFDLAAVGERTIGHDIVEKYVFADNGTVVPTGRPIRDRGDGVMLDMTPMGNFGGSKGREVRSAKFRIERYIAATPGEVGPRVPTLPAVPVYSPKAERESTRETRVVEPVPGPGLMRSVTPGVRTGTAA